jgi:hypothetical protein
VGGRAKGGAYGLQIPASESFDLRIVTRTDLARSFRTRFASAVRCSISRIFSFPAQKSLRQTKAPTIGTDRRRRIISIRVF